jgi:Transglycosylase SLT domain
MPVPYLACMLAAASFYHLPPRVLPSIQAVEGGRPGLVSRNTDGSADLGVMQVNTLWVRRFAQVTRLPPAEVYHRLIDDPCFNIAAAGAIVRFYLSQDHGDVVRAVGDYHSHTPVRAAAYQAKVIHAASRLFTEPARPAAASTQPPRQVSQRTAPHPGQVAAITASPPVTDR